MSNNNNKIAEYILLAQVYSDAGKEIYELCPNWVFGSRGYCYTLKDRYVSRAIREICKSKDSDFSFYVCEDADGVADYLVYFNTKLGSERLQVSFHSFNDDLKRYLKNSKTHKTKWDKKSSRDTCRILEDVYLS